MANKLIMTLSTETFKNPQFRDDYNKLIKSIFSDENKIDKDKIIKLLKTAFIFSLNHVEAHQSLATKIVVFLLEKYKEEVTNIPFFAEIVFTRLGDLPIIQHMIENKHEKDIFSYFEEKDYDFDDLFYFPEVLRKKLQNQIEIGNQTANFTDFQAKIFQHLNNGTSMAFSAPTSAGKSYVIHNFIAKQVLEKAKYNVVYIVPTKALIYEVQRSIINHLQKLEINLKDVMITTSPNSKIIDQFDPIMKKIFILTQERLQQILAHDTNLQINLLVVDEAQKINDDSRGAILEDVIDEILQKHQTQTVFIVPNVNNPEKFKNIFKMPESFKSEKTQRTPVSQNIFLLNFEDNEVTIKLKIKEFGTTLNLKSKHTKLTSKDSQYKHKVWTAINILQNKGHTLIYCNKPTDCITIGNEMIKNLEQIDNKKLEEVIEFLKNNVHEYYYLVDFLRYGIGYHYGNMQKFVRFIVKDLFDDKLINYLCSTSTLLEGVNLPVNNIILHTPRIGSTSMSTDSILNLAGRAGRLGRDYYGNIYCIELEKWENGEDVFDGVSVEVKSIVERIFTNNMTTLLRHLEKYIEPWEKVKNIDGIKTVSNSLMIKQLNNINFKDFFKKYPVVTDEDEIKITLALKNIEDAIFSLDKSIILKNKGIDPRLQHNLYEHLKKGNLILPPYPGSQNFYNDLKSIFELISQFLLKNLEINHLECIKIAYPWLNQKSYKFILENMIWRRKKRINKNNFNKKEINKIINDLDKILERDLKFDFSKSLQCYCDIVEHILVNKNDKSDFCKDLATFLEAGAHDPKILLLMSIGLSRNNSITLSGIIDEDIIAPIDMLEWLRTHMAEIRKKIKNDVSYREIEHFLKN